MSEQPMNRDTLLPSDTGPLKPGYIYKVVSTDPAHSNAQDGKMVYVDPTGSIHPVVAMKPASEAEHPNDLHLPQVVNKDFLPDDKTCESEVEVEDALDPHDGASLGEESSLKQAKESSEVAQSDINPHVDSDQAKEDVNKAEPHTGAQAELHTETHSDHKKGKKHDSPDDHKGKKKQGKHKKKHGKKHHESDDVAPVDDRANRTDSVVAEVAKEAKIAQATNAAQSAACSESQSAQAMDCREPQDTQTAVRQEPEQPTVEQQSTTEQPTKADSFDARPEPINAQPSVHYLLVPADEYQVASSNGVDVVQDTNTSIKDEAASMQQRSDIEADHGAEAIHRDDVTATPAAGEQHIGTAPAAGEHIGTASVVEKQQAGTASVVGEQHTSTAPAAGEQHINAASATGEQHIDATPTAESQHGAVAPTDHLSIAEQAMLASNDPRSAQQNNSNAQVASAKKDSNKKGKHSHRGWHIALIIMIILLAILIGLCVYVGSCFAQTQKSMAFDQDKKAELDETLTPTEYTEPFYVLVIGSDWREGSGTSDDEAESGNQQRSDVMILVRVDRANNQLTFVTIPRDTPWIGPDGQQHKLNESLNRGGVSSTINAVEDLTGVSISHYVEVNFSNLEDIVDGIGGVEVDVPQTLSYEDALTNTTVTLQPGRQTINGQQAQIFSRARHEFVEDQDMHRQQDVRQLGEAIIEKIIQQPAYNLSPCIVHAMKESKTDIDLMDFMPFMLDFASSGVDVYSCTGPSDGDNDPDQDGVWYCYRDPAGWQQLMAVVDAGEDPDTLSAA